MKRCVSTRLALRERNRVASDGARKPKGSSLLAHRPRRERTEHCAICLEHFQLPDCKQEEERPHSIALINRCKHMFHQHCWAAYVKTHIQMRAFSVCSPEKEGAWAHFTAMRHRARLVMPPRLARVAPRTWGMPNPCDGRWRQLPSG